MQDSLRQIKKLKLHLLNKLLMISMQADQHTVSMKETFQFHSLPMVKHPDKKQHGEGREARGLHSQVILHHCRDILVARAKAAGHSTSKVKSRGR